MITPTPKGLELRREEEAILRQVSLATRLTPAQERTLVRLKRLTRLLEQ